MDISEFLKSQEKQIHKSLDELFDRANLTKLEREIFLKYKRYCEYWLLRSKYQYSKPFNSSDTNFIKLIAIVLLNLQSERVIGAKDQIVKKMFSDKTVHKIYPTKNGLRSTKISGNIENTYFELKILSFFLKNEFKIELASNKIVGKKIPEFTCVKEGMRISVEAKNLHYDKILDSIHGDYFTKGIDKKLSKTERDRGYRRIYNQFKRNYDNAIMKYKENEDEYFIIFIQTHYKWEYLGPYAAEYINNLKNEWAELNYKRLLGVVLPDSEKTIFIENAISNRIIIQEIKKMKIKKIYNYLPKLINL